MTIRFAAHLFVIRKFSGTSLFRTSEEALAIYEQHCINSGINLVKKEFVRTGNSLRNSLKGWGDVYKVVGEVEFKGNNEQTRIFVFNTLKKADEYATFPMLYLSIKFS